MQRRWCRRRWPRLGRSHEQPIDHQCSAHRAVAWYGLGISGFGSLSFQNSLDPIGASPGVFLLDLQRFLQEGKRQLVFGMLGWTRAMVILDRGQTILLERADQVAHMRG
mgnify:CR=1 FL=1